MLLWFYVPDHDDVLWLGLLLGHLRLGGSNDVGLGVELGNREGCCSFVELYEDKIKNRSDDTPSYCCIC